MIKRNKKAVSAMIGYVLLIAFAIVMGGLIFNWMKSYVPKDALKCPDGVSMFIKEIECTNSVLNLTLKNNGRFNVAGYFIRGAKEGEEVATIDLSSNVMQGGGIRHGNAILFSQGENILKPGEKKDGKFDLGDNALMIKLIEIIPIRFEVVENKKRVVTCGNAKMREVLDCGVGEEEGEIQPECTNDDDCGIDEVCIGNVCNTLCGNGIIDGVEECDSTDYCTGECICEDGYFSLEGICTST